jgi:nitrite reductase/ring-hydroxylating ferredoxin subunit
MPTSQRHLGIVDRRGDACAGCPRASRRGFLGQLSGAVLLTALGSELADPAAWALPVTAAPGAQGGGGERTYPLPAADGVTIDRDAQVIVVRHRNRVYAFSLACPHENTALRWRQQDVRFQCPRHESTYQPDGTFISGRATRNMDRFALRRDGESVVVDLNRSLRSDQQPDAWRAAVLTL